MIEEGKGFADSLVPLQCYEPHVTAVIPRHRYNQFQSSLSTEEKFERVMEQVQTFTGLDVRMEVA